MGQTQQKDVLIYDPYGSAIFNWDNSEVNLFPVESLYGIIEVKTSIRSQADLLTAVDQTLEVKNFAKLIAFMANRLLQQYSPLNQR